MGVQLATHGKHQTSPRIGKTVAYVLRASVISGVIRLALDDLLKAHPE